MKKKLILIFLLIVSFANNSNAGCIEGNCINGKGVFKWNIGPKYIGEFKDNKMHGKGSYYFNDGTTYVGSWKNGKRHGQGILTYIEGDKFDGEYRYGKANGKGTFTFINGNKYIGEFKNDLKHGKGSYYWSNGSKYIGNYKNNKQHGVGKIIEVDGNIYATKHIKGYEISRTLINEDTNNKKNLIFISGTSFFVSNNGYLISAYHIVKDCKKISIFYKNKQFDAAILAIDKANDLVILKTNILPDNSFGIDVEDASVLDDVIIAGYPFGKKISSSIKISKGSVTATMGYGNNDKQFQTDAILNKGNSGGPILNNKGNVIGVVISSYGKKEGIEGFNFGVKSSIINNFINLNEIKTLSPSKKKLNNKELEKIIVDATALLECKI